jgi:SAM-dependent methyltransferase/uncharacterized protein YbaR (Trm112 family)
MVLTAEAYSKFAPEDGIPGMFVNLGDILECPETRSALRLEGSEFVSVQTRKRYPTTDGIPNFFVPTDGLPPGVDVTDLVKQFYEETPFPNYDDFDSRESLSEKARRSVFGNMLDSQIPQDAVVLEAGCGTGQLTNFLGMSWRRRVFGGDICLNSLRLAKAFRDRYSIRNAAFLQMNLFRPPFRDNSFDLIISNGVLHHTADPEGGFAALVKKLKPGGIISVGLYNSYARLPTLWRRWLFERFGESLHFLDPRLRSDTGGRLRAWYMDQYRHPHESRHSMDEVLGWFARHDIEFLSGIPHPDDTDFTRDDRLFRAHSTGSRLTRAGTQLGMLLEGGADGGLFIMIGRRRTKDVWG